MKALSYIKLIFLLLYFTACNNHPNPESILLKTNLSSPKKYKILDFKSDWAIGESREEYLLTISKEDYQKISKEIERKKFFQRIDSSKVPTLAFDNTTDINKTKETACGYNNKYFYQIFIHDQELVITVVLEKDSLMSILYDDL
ncbi:MAG: hypothetical protein N3F62_08080 [Bacteroidia bacterium]|jgi:hypothetical protein|nr:hypothetical protein [Bacteroidia bacterium]